MARLRTLAPLAAIVIVPALVGCGFGKVWHGLPALERGAGQDEAGAACHPSTVIEVVRTGYQDEALWPALVQALGSRPELEGVDVRLEGAEHAPGALLLVPTFEDRTGGLSIASGILSVLTFTIVPGVVVTDRRLRIDVRQVGCAPGVLVTTWSETTVAWLPFGLASPDVAFMAFADDKQLRAGDLPGRLAEALAPALARLAQAGRVSP